MGVTLEPLRQVFLPAILDALLQEAASHSLLSSVLHRLEVLGACGPYPTEPERRLRVRDLRAERAAWEAYLDAAAACDVLPISRLGRLRGLPEDDFLNAMAECMSVWLCAARLGWQLVPQPLSGSRPFEGRIPGSTAEVQLSARVPFLGKPIRRIASVDDLDLLRDDVQLAAQHFFEGGPNVLVLAPGLSRRVPDGSACLALLHAARHRRPDPRSPYAMGPPAPNILSDGKMLQEWAAQGWLPDRARIDAIVYVEEILVDRHPFPWDPLFEFSFASEANARGLSGAASDFEEALLLHLGDDNAVHLDHRIFVVLNPHSEHPLEASAFGGLPVLGPIARRSGAVPRGPKAALIREEILGPRRRRRRGGRR